MIYKTTVIIIILSVLFLGCTGVPKGMEPVSGFDGAKYMGKWYEIARLDHSFEKNLSNVSALYTAKENGEIGVLNRGYNEKTGEWKQIEGKARFVGDETIGSLKVSFFGPFYGGYHIIELDRVNYSYAMVSGPSLSYLWILSRTKVLDEAIYSKLVTRAGALGFDTSKLIQVVHDRTANILSPEGATEMHSKAANRLTPCPNSPNCVSSLAENNKQFIEPIPFKDEHTIVQHELLEILDTFKRVQVVRRDDNYVHAEFKSFVFRFVDDVEFYFDDVQKVIQIKSASRKGYSDLGVNRRRLEKIRKLFEEGALKRDAEAT